MKKQLGWVLAGVLAMGSVARAEMREVQIPLRDGKLSIPQLTETLTQKLGLPGIEWGNGAIDMQGMGKSAVTMALNKALGEGCQVAVSAEALTIKYDTEKLPSARQATRTFTAEIDPVAAANQAAKYGLLLPKKVEAEKRTVILLHGVDCTRECLSSLADLLGSEGYQVAYYGYPDDQAIADSAKRFTDELKATRELFPKMPIDVVAFSMGSLVARETIEGPDYPGGVGRLILLAPPNHGSKWAYAREALEWRQQWEQWRHDPNYKWTWSITDGLGEAGSDLLPDSTFLKQLNDRPRRDGVKYTIINGNVHPVWKMGADLAEGTRSLLGDRVSGWIKADALADKLRNHEAKSDGPVSLESTKLAGVDDVVTLRADHNMIYQGADGQPPAAWETIRDRLKK